MVGGKNDDGSIGHAVLIECGEHFANRLVHGFDHGGVNDVGLHGAVLARRLGFEGVFKSELLAALFVFLNEILAADQRSVDAVEIEHREEWLVFVFTDEIGGLGGKAVGQVLARRAILESWISVRGEIFLSTIRSSSVVAAEVVIESMVFRPRPLGAEVPFAGVEGSVTFSFECFTHAGVGFGELTEIGGWPDRAVAGLLEIAVGDRVEDFRQGLTKVLVRPSKVVGVAGACRPLAGHQGGTRG